MEEATLESDEKEKREADGAVARSLSVLLTGRGGRGEYFFSRVRTRGACTTGKVLSE